MDAPSPTYLGPPDKFSSGDNKPINRIVLHGTVSACGRGQARETAAYFRSPSASGSAHYVVDPLETVQSAYDSVIAWHAPPNPNSLGIEMTDMVGGPHGPLPIERWDERGHKLMLLRAASLTAQLCLAYKVPPKMIGPRALKKGKHGVCEHDDVSDAFHQSDHWDLGNFPRGRFQHLLAAAVADLQAKPDVARKQRAKADSRITRARDLITAAARNSKPARRRRLQTALTELPQR